MFEKRIGQKPGKSTSSLRHRNRSGVVDLVGREPLMFAKGKSRTAWQNRANIFAGKCKNAREKHAQLQYSIWNI